MHLHILRSPESENHIFSVMVYVYVCISVISITQKQTTSETSNLILCICIICRWYLKLFVNIGQIVCRGTQKNSKTIRSLLQQKSQVKYIISSIIDALNEKHLAKNYCNVFLLKRHWITFLNLQQHCQCVLFLVCWMWPAEPSYEIFIFLESSTQ